MNKRVLVLGANGMVGRVLFTYFKNYFPESTFGTVRSKKILKKNLFLFRAGYAKKDLKSIQKKIKKIDFVINCIVEKDEKKILDMIIVNSYFPHLLANLAKINNFKLIHISTDFVFRLDSGIVNEQDRPTPQTIYGISKLLGETDNKNSITFRSSFLGFHPIKKFVLLERIFKEKEKIQEGYINQKWSGCTTVQFAKLCKNIIYNNYFTKLKRYSSLFHFAPIKPISKYRLIKEILKSNNSNYTLEKKIGIKRTMALKTTYFDILRLDRYTDRINKVISELFKFENKIKKNEEI